MGNILHANVKTTLRIKQEIQNFTASIAVLTKHYQTTTISRWIHSKSITAKKSGAKIRKKCFNLSRTTGNL